MKEIVWVDPGQSVMTCKKCVTKECTIYLELKRYFKCEKIEIKERDDGPRCST